MLRRLIERLDFTRGLGFRLGGLLSLAILPIGLISVVQTLHLSREYERSIEIALLGRTSTAAAGERALLQGALGSADALGPAVLETMNNPSACSEIMARFIESNATFAYAGFTSVNGTSNCSSIGGSYDLTSTPGFKEFVANPGTLVTASDRDSITGTPVVTVSQPLYRGEELIGYIAVAMARDLLRSSHMTNLATEGARILTFNNFGQIISMDQDNGADYTRLLPKDKSLTSLLARSETIFRSKANNGQTRVFSVVPVVPGLVYALGSWNTAQSGVSGIYLTRFAVTVLPIALWIVSLIVAYFAVYRLVLRHIRELRGQMRRFAIGDRASPPPVLSDAPAEIADMSQTFHNMARILIRDEVALEDAVQEKTVLLKEVHHRVKNNLQLIASIINMQIRAIDHDQARRVLRSVQDRVASLATIYRNLYQAEHLDAVNADQLISDIINQMANASIEPGENLRIQTDLAPLVLMPDQAVPLSLLTTEAFTNALKYAGAGPNGEDPWVRVSVKPDDEDAKFAVIEVSNSCSPGQIQGKIEGTGLGHQLMEAFAMQLEGEVEIDQTPQSFTLRLRFPAVQVPPNLHPSDARRVVLTSAAKPGAKH